LRKRQEAGAGRRALRVPPRTPRNEGRRRKRGGKDVEGIESAAEDVKEG
jgi:hypothetical protein